MTLTHMDTQGYHLRELAIAQRADDPAHIMPAIRPSDRRILDVGCGAGQTLIASDLPADGMACGIDVDVSALSLGKALTRRVCLVCGAGEWLPLRSDYFDLVISRVAVPYMHIPTALSEMARVLRTGGRLWIVLHAPSLTLRELLTNLSRFELKAALYRLYVLANGLALHWLGTQFHFPFATHPCESCQTATGIRRALDRAGFREIAVVRHRFFVVTATKAPRAIA